MGTIVNHPSTHVTYFRTNWFRFNFLWRALRKTIQNYVNFVGNNTVIVFPYEKTSTCYLFAISPHLGTMATRLSPWGSVGCLGVAAFNGCEGPASHLLHLTMLLSRTSSFLFSLVLCDDSKSILLKESDQLCQLLPQHVRMKAKHLLVIAIPSLLCPSSMCNT